MKHAIRVAAFFLLFATSANAQILNPVTPLDGGAPVGSGNPLHVTGSFSASLGGFVPSLSYTTLTATASSSASTALPTNTGTVAFQNQNSVAVSCTLASGSATATTNEIIVPAGSTVFIGTTGYSNAACINQTGSASNVIVLAGGAGLGTGFGGGSSGSGGSTNITQTAGTNINATIAATGALPVDAQTTSNLYAALTAALPINKNGTVTAATGATPGTAQTGTQVNQDVGLNAVANTALGTPAAYGSTPTGNALSVNAASTLTALYPNGATPVSASNTGTTAATTATLAGTTGKTTYVCSYSIRANATATTTVQNTLTGILGGTDTHEFWVPANTAGIGIDEQVFMPCHPASAQNTAISAVSGAPGAGGVVSVTIKGYQQ